MSDSNIIYPQFSSAPLDEDLPLPEAVIKQLGGNLDYIDVPDAERKYLVREWVYWVSGSRAKDRHKPWSDLKRTMVREGFKVGEILDTLAVDTSGGPQLTDFASANGLYQITQRMADKSATVRSVKKYLADAGVILDVVRTDPERAEQLLETARRRKWARSGKDDGWIETREFSIFTRKEFVRYVCQLLGPDAPVGHVTNDVYRGVFKKDAAGLREDLGVAPGQSPRDYMGRLQLAYVIAAEEACKIALADFSEDDLLPVFLVRDVVSKIAKAVGFQASDMAAMLKIDLITGRPLLPPSKDDGLA